MHYFESVEQLQVLSDNTGVLIAKGQQIQHIDTDGAVRWQHEFPHGIRYLASSPSAKGFFVQLENLTLGKVGRAKRSGKFTLSGSVQHSGFTASFTVVVSSSVDVGGYQHRISPHSV